MEISAIKDKCQDETIEVTQPMLRRLQQRHITYCEVKEAILQGEIIEEYPTDFPYPSCLILGVTIAGQILHVVAGLSETNYGW